MRSHIAGTIWSEETVCEVYIAQPWYWTWWARLLYLLIIALVIWYEWHQYQQRLSLRRQLDQRLTALYAVESLAPANPIPGSPTPSPSHEGEGRSLTPDPSPMGEGSLYFQHDETAEDVTTPLPPAGGVGGGASGGGASGGGAGEPVETAQQKAANQRNKDFLDKLDHLILQNLLQTDLDVNFLAQEMCVSYSTLHRRIKSLTGMTANEYVRKHRLTKAMQMLRDGIPATEVSMQCGFNSPSYFTRCFKAEYGMLPSEI